VAFATDLPALTAWGVPYLYGPGSIHVAHSDHEYVEIAQLERAVETYERIARAVVERAASEPRSVRLTADG
jgi:acetylornithine deacetylase